jgi:hypothetical protein
MASRARLITVVELPEFLRAATKVWSEEDRAAFVDFIAAHPTAGVIVEGTGGVRKVRWGREGVGKRGGVRVIYYYLDEDVPLFLISLFAKSSKADLNAQEKRNAHAFVRSIKKSRNGE